MADRLRVLSLVACVTGKRLMLPLQGVTGQGVIEAHRLADPVKGFFGVAINAVLSEFIVVNVPMTARAVFIGYPGKFLHFHPAALDNPVAFYAIDPGMAPDQRKTGPVVLKFPSRFKGLMVMTGGAFGRECALVIVSVAGKAGRIESQIRF